MKIRKATIDDLDQIWPIFSEVVSKGDTYVFDPETPKTDFQKHWFGNNVSTWVAQENQEIVGTYIIKPNQPALGSHIANCSYMVKPNCQGRGIGGSLCNHSLEIARQSGYHAMQFNIVVSNNPAVHLWEKMGFKIIGTTPDGFNHKQVGYVDTHIMYKKL